MVESIGPKGLTPLTRTRAVRKDKVDGKPSSGRDGEQPQKKPRKKPPDKPVVGGNIDEMC
tara:strand:- start:114623 stop:114802 length:180 start_codon:yes stop_codon:yes gene_type:complete